MKSTRKLKTAITATMLALTCLACGTASAQHRHHHWHLHPHRVVTVVSRPAVTLRVSNHVSQKERFAMAMAYLKNHGSLSARKYARMTCLTKMAAEAELDAFAADKDKPIMAVIQGKKKVYVIKHKQDKA